MYVKSLNLTWFVEKMVLNAVEDGFAMASKALRSFGEELTGMDVARAQSILAGSLSGRVSDLSEGARLMSGTSAVREAQDKIVDMLQYVSQLSASAIL